MTPLAVSKQGQDMDFAQQDKTGSEVKFKVNFTNEILLSKFK
jgi:hypothetical protein